MLSEACYIVCLKCNRLGVLLLKIQGLSLRRKSILKLWHLMDVRPSLLFFYGITSLEEYIDGMAGACIYT